MTFYEHHPDPVNCFGLDGDMRGRETNNDGDVDGSIRTSVLRRIFCFIVDRTGNQESLFMKC